MLTKSALPLPDKFHGLTDVSKRYRNRHLDLMVNPAVRETFHKRARITSSSPPPSPWRGRRGGGDWPPPRTATSGRHGGGRVGVGRVTVAVEWWWRWR